MNNGGDAAEQVVRLSLEGFEVAAKLTGSAAKNVALLLVSVLKQEQQTKGKARLTNMIKSGKELKVFSIPNKDLAQFTKQAKRYGVLYCVLRDKSAKGDDVPVDIIARAEDASKFSALWNASRSARSIRQALSRRQSRTRLTVKRWHGKCRPKPRARSSWRKQWESLCRKKVSPTKTLRSQRRKKALRPSEAPRSAVRLLTGVQQSRQTRSLP